MEVQENSRTCLSCASEITGRIDKKYCSDYCRTNFYNERNRSFNQFARNVNSTLKKNRTILASLNPTGKAKVSKDKLLDRGFNFHYFTNTFQTRTGNKYKFCYDQGYLALEKNQYMLVERQEYVP